MCDQFTLYRVCRSLRSRFASVVAALAILATAGTLLFAQVAPPASGQAKPKLPVPPQADQQKVLGTLAEIYDLGKERTDEQKLKLVKELLDLVSETKKPTDKFVLLRKTMELARDAGDAVLMCEVIDRIGNDYQIDTLLTQGKMLTSIAAKANTAERIGSLVDASGAYIDRAVAQGKFDFAQNIATLAYRASQSAKGKDFRKETLDRCREVQRLRADHQKLESALLAVQANPDDAEANLIVGRSFCFAHGDWQRGLPFLVKGSDAELAALARSERDAPTEATDQVKLADAWWDLAMDKKGTEKKGTAKEVLLRRAGFWYEKAGSGTLTGLAKLKVERRLDELAKIVSESLAAKARRPGKPKTQKGLTIDLGGGVKMEFVLVKPGQFVMGMEGVKGSEAHMVKITKPFYLGKYEVTQAQYAIVMGKNPSEVKGADLPVENVAWGDSQKFVAQASGLPHYTFRLPTEAEWEYACRAGTKTQYHNGTGEMALEKVGWYSENSGGKTHPVGKKSPNAWGLHDMHGNVSEFVRDRDGRYPTHPLSVDPQGPSEGYNRRHRGGSWDTNASRCCSASRGGDNPGRKRADYGFRCVVVRDAAEPPAGP